MNGNSEKKQKVSGIILNTESDFDSSFFLAKAVMFSLLLFGTIFTYLYFGNMNLFYDPKLLPLNSLSRIISDRDNYLLFYSIVKNLVNNLIYECLYCTVAYDDVTVIF